MHILRSWYDSLSLLLPAQLKLFSLVSLLSTWKTYTLLVRQWAFWLLVGCMAVWGYLDQYMIQPYWCLVFTSGLECIFKKFIWHCGAFLIAMTMVLLVCAATRPSVDLKKSRYFKDLIRRGILIMGSIMVIQCIGYLSMVLTGAWATNLASVVFVSNWAKTCSVLYVLFALFMFDAADTAISIIPSIKKTVIMAVYNLPLLVVLNVVIHALEMGFYLLLAYVNLDTQFFAWFVIWLATMPLIVNVWTNIYIKKVHEHPDLYFVAPK